MAGSFYTWEESLALEAHAAWEDGAGVVVTGASDHYIGKTAAPTAGGKIDYVTVTSADAAGQSIDVAKAQIGDVVQLRADAAVAVDAKVMVTVTGRFITATSTNTAQFKAIQAGEQDSVFSAIRIVDEVIA
jgi:hypothetical protein